MTVHRTAQTHGPFLRVKVPPTEESSGCCSHIQRREGRPTRRKPGVKSPRGARETWPDPSRGASNLTGRSKREPVKPRKPGPRETDCGSIGSAEPLGSRQAASASRHWTHAMSNSPGSERTACQDGMVAKARNHSRVASALPHSEGIAYKPPCGEVAMCRRVGRMGPVKRGRTGTA